MIAPYVRIVSGALVASMAGSSIAHANPWDLYGFNARALGMANAHTAYADDFTAVYYNPAALTARRNPGFGVGYTLAVPQLSLRFENPDPAVEPIDPPRADGLTFGASLPLGRYVALALGLSVPTGSLLSGQSPDPLVPHWYMVQALPRRVVSALGLGVRPHRLIGVGLAVQILGGVQGKLDYQLDLVTGTFSRKSVTFDVQPVASPIVGLEFGPLAGVRLGFVWRGPIETRVDLPVDLELVGVADLAIATLFTVQYNPHQLAAGASVRWPSLKLDVTFDLTYAFWSTAPDPSVNSRLQVDGELVEGTGLDEALDAPAPGRERNVDLGFSNVWVPRFGLEHRRDIVAFRAGYAFRPTPAPRQTSGANYVDGLSHVFTLGAGIELRDPAGLARDRMSIDLGGALMWYPPRAHDKGAADDPVGSFIASGVTYALAVSFRYVVGAAAQPARPRSAGVGDHRVEAPAADGAPLLGITPGSRGSR